MLSNHSSSSISGSLAEIDPVALGQAGLQALALAGTAILARYATVEERADGMTDLEGTLPHPQWSILMRAIGAFADPAHSHVLSNEDERQAEAVAAMCLRARTVLAREHRMAPRQRSASIPDG
ncbi:hypothetical protein [Actinopolymorpha alba]|uniref:hypothetical protein n=1 Tax=Actinopolymorpha alba TaxID=533267 RepID=UPI00035E318E|nr:hypothetical protein [Actinopolymorpha alba]